MVNAVLLDAKDTVATVTKAIAPGEAVQYLAGGALCAIRAVQPIPIYHKISICPVDKGRDVVKYGERIGVALLDICPGEHVHVHNLGSHVHNPGSHVHNPGSHVHDLGSGEAGGT